ncbi:DnaJ-like protein subfamily C member 19 [Enteropsectra breve]|nr:DnaJ-like protein subfamily C member 19 [Enteropsectra breve]
MLAKVKSFVAPFFSSFSLGIRIPFNLGNRGGFGEMSNSKAMKILNVRRGDSIVERYHRMMKINHPDMGGSSYIASKINEAKNYLLEYNSRL